MDNLSKKILITLAYYDAMDYPVTAFEIWKYLVSWSMEHGTYSKEEKNSLANIVKGLESEEIRKKIEEYRGYYFLKNRKDLVEKRLENNKISEVKFKKIKKVVWFLRFVPFVRMVAVTGTMAMKNSRSNSDLDLFVVLKRGHIFTGRTLVTGLVHLLGMRRYREKITDRICLNFFVTDRSLKTDLGEIFSAENKPDMAAITHFNASEHFFIMPMFDLGNFKKFQEENSWIKRSFENFQCENICNLKKIPDGIMARAIRNLGEYIFSFRLIEQQLKKWQRERIANDARTHLPASLVKADDDYLIFLPEPQGEAIFASFQKELGRNP